MGQRNLLSLEEFHGCKSDMLEGGKRVGGKADTRKKQKISRSVGGERALPRMGITQNAGWQNMGNGERKIWHVNMGVYSGKSANIP